MKNLILRTLAWLNGISFAFFVCLIDSASLIPFNICCVNIAWLGLFAYANNWFEDWEE